MYHSTLGLRVIKKTHNLDENAGLDDEVLEAHLGGHGIRGVAPPRV